MKYTIILLVSLLSAYSASGQPLMKLKVTEHDFGIFSEDAGKQSFTFLVTNVGDQPLVIQNIVASCGCTTPEWTRSPIAPLGEGKITAVYDPANRPGPFRKTLSVFSNSSPSPVVLSVKGEVFGRLKTTSDYYPWQVGTLRFQGNSIAFPVVLNTEKRIRVLPMINTSGTPVKIEFADVPAYIELKAVPHTLKPGQKGIIECMYFGTKVAKWGNVTDIVKLRLDDKVQSPELFIQAIVTEDFSVLTKAELANAPVFKPASTKIDLGQMEAGEVKEIVFTFKNDGKRDLFIRSIWSTCTCMKVSADNGSVIAPGSSGSLKVVFMTEKLSGKTSRSFYIYTNDPANAKVVFSVQALVSKKK
jgi:hypothetical protein